MTATHISIILIMVIAMIGFYFIARFLFNKMEKNNHSIEISPELAEKIDGWLEYIISISPEAMSSTNIDKQQDDQIDKTFELESANKRTALDPITPTEPSAPIEVASESSAQPLPLDSLINIPEALFESPRDHYQLPLQFDEKA